MKTDKALVFILIAILLAFGITEVVYTNYKYPSYKSLPMFVEVTNKVLVGVNTRTDGLYFGIVPTGDAGRRFINITNPYSTPVQIQITTKGTIAFWVQPDKNYFVLNPGEATQIVVQINIPLNATVGNYTGNMFILMKRT